MNSLKFFLAPGATLPMRAKDDDAGFDLSALLGEKEIALPPLTRVVISTGVHVALPRGYYGRVAPRSGLAVNNGIAVLAGVVDAGYRGEVKVALYNTDRDKTFVVTPGSRIAQLVVTKIADKLDILVVGNVDDLGASDRGAGGFGSTGK